MYSVMMLQRRSASNAPKLNGGHDDSIVPWRHERVQSVVGDAMHNTATQAGIESTPYRLTFVHGELVEGVAFFVGHGHTWERSEVESQPRVEAIEEKRGNRATQTCSRRGVVDSSMSTSGVGGFSPPHVLLPET